MNNLQILYSKTATGKIRSWKIYVEKGNDSSDIITETGMIDGKITKFSMKINEGKNNGKLNATTHYEQALKEAASKHKKRIDTGDKLSIAELDNKSKLISPMLAFDYNKRKHNIIFPCIVQPKLDGVRAVYVNGKFYSRNGKEFTSCSNLLKDNNGKHLLFDKILDGELYTKDFPFEVLVGLIKKTNLSNIDIENLRSVKYHVFDIIDKGKFVDRYKEMKSICSSVDNINIVENKIVNGEDEIMNYHGSYIEHGYEGIMVRNINSIYKESRSADLQKYKQSTDDEFEIIGVTDGIGKELECAIFILKCNRGTFNARPIGNTEYRKKLFKDKNNLIGKKLTVRYQELSVEGIPRFPVGLIVRDYE